MKITYVLSILATLVVVGNCCTGNIVRMANLDYVQPETSKKIHYGFKYSNMTMKYHVLNETDIDQTVFKFIWNYSNDDEIAKGHQMILDSQKDFEEMREDYGFLVVFFGKQITQLKFYKKTEFGSAYTIEFMQANTPVQIQLQIKAGEPNEQEFHSIIQKIIDKRQHQESLLFLQE